MWLIIATKKIHTYIYTYTPYRVVYIYVYVNFAIQQKVLTDKALQSETESSRAQTAGRGGVESSTGLGAIRR